MCDHGPLKGKKRPFLLVETLIAFSIALLILTIGSTLIYTFVRLQNTSREQFQEALYKRVLTTRYRTILSSMHYIKGRKPLVHWNETHAENNRLLFTGDNGISRDPRLANEVLVLFFIDSEGLHASFCPDPLRKDMGQFREVSYLIWPKAKTITWRFLGKKNLSDQSFEWTDEWSEEALPLVIETTIESEKGKESITTLIPESITAKKPLPIRISSQDMEVLFQGELSPDDSDLSEEEKEWGF